MHERVGNPQCKRIVIGTALHHVPIVSPHLFLIQQEESRQIGRRGKEESELMLFGALVLLQVLSLEVREESTQQQVVGQEAGIMHRSYRIYRDAIHKNRILSHCRHRRGNHDGVQESDCFQRVIVRVITIQIVQSKHLVLPRCHSSHGKGTTRIGAGNALKRHVRKRRIGKIRMDPHVNTGNRFEVLRVKHPSRDSERVQLIPRGERINKVLQRVPLVIIHDRIGKIDGIGGIGQQRIVQLYHCPSADGANHRHIPLGRGDDHLLGGAFNFYIFIKLYLDPGRGRIQGVEVGGCPSHHRWVYIVRTSRGRCHIRARVNRDGKQQEQEEGREK